MNPTFCKIDKNTRQNSPTDSHRKCNVALAQTVAYNFDTEPVASVVAKDK